MLIYVFITESYNTTFHCVPGLMSSKKTKWFDSKCMQENAEKTNWFLTIKGFRISSMQKTAGFYCSVLFFNIPQRLKATTHHRLVNQTFIVNKKRGIISEGECPSHNITLHNKSFDTSSRHTLSRFTKYLWITLPFLYHDGQGLAQHTFGPFS